jgi:hypothetical protein
MRHFRVVLVVVVGILLVRLPASSQSKTSPLVPPQSNAFGLPFDEWNVLQVQWTIETQLGGQNVSPTVRNAKFYPERSSEPDQPLM